MSPTQIARDTAPDLSGRGRPQKGVNGSRLPTGEQALPVA